MKTIDSNLNCPAKPFPTQRANVQLLLTQHLPDEYRAVAALYRKKMEEARELELYGEYLEGVAESAGVELELSAVAGAIGRTSQGGTKQ